jgi:hypothetical protein
MPLTDAEIREKVIKHDYEFKALTKGMESVVKEMHSLVTLLKETVNDKILVLDKNLKDSFERVHKRADGNESTIREIQKERATTGCRALKDTNNAVDTLNRTVYGKDGRGGLIFDVEDIKKFMYKVMGGFTFINIAIGVLVAIATK